MVAMPRAEQFEEMAKVLPKAPPRRSWLKLFEEAAVALAALGVVLAAATYAYDYLTVGRYLESTDDAYVQADYTIIAPKVSGYIADVLVTDNQAVKAGQVLAHIDDRDFRAALAQARSNVEAAEAAIRNIDAQIELQQSLIAEADAAVTATQASLAFAEADAARYHDLSKTGYGTLQRAEQTESVRAASTAQLQRDKATLAAAKGKVAVLTTAREQALAERDRAAAAVEQADLNLSYTTIAAPVDGTVGARSLRVGQYVAAGTELMAVVPLNALYVVANFKETQVTDVRPGQPVDVEVDGFPGIRLKGHVDSLAPASGLEFSLLPPDNATGNFTKIVQRIPIRIVMNDAKLAGMLRPGMSVVPTIDTKATVLAERKPTGAAEGGALGSTVLPNRAG